MRRRVSCGVPQGVPRRRAGGFTLLEVIIAFALLALALTLLLGSLSGASRQIRHADHASRATLHAQSLLAQVGVGEVLRPGRSEGEFADADYRWTLEVSPYQDPAIPVRNLQLGAPRLLQVDLEVRWGDAPRDALRWHSLRLVAAAPDSQDLLP